MREKILSENIQLKTAKRRESKMIRREKERKAKRV